jgi:hypothetical protein
MSNVRLADQPPSVELEQVLTSQNAWARRRGFRMKSHRALARPEDALFLAIDDATRARLRAGAGGELKRIHSFRSSTALALNVFSPWKGNAISLASALGAPILAITSDSSSPTPPGSVRDIHISM